VLVNEIVAQLVIGHSAVQDIRKFVFTEFLDHFAVNAGMLLAEMGDLWKSNGTSQ
jgi:hypothetical protein